MLNNFELRRSRARCVGQFDMCCLVCCQTGATVGFLLGGFLVYYKRYYYIPDGVLVYIVYSALILFGFVSVDFYAITGLLKATSKNESTTAEKALSLCHLWLPLNIFFLLTGILIVLIAFQEKCALVLLILVPFRVYMITIVKSYMDALTERVSETRPHNELCLHAIFGSLDTNEFRFDIV